MIKFNPITGQFDLAGIEIPERTSDPASPRPNQFWVLARGARVRTSVTKQAGEPLGILASVTNPETSTYYIYTGIPEGSPIGLLASITHTAAYYLSYRSMSGLTMRVQFSIDSSAGSAGGHLLGEGGEAILNEGGGYILNE